MLAVAVLLPAVNANRRIYILQQFFADALKLPTWPSRSNVLPFPGRQWFMFRQRGQQLQARTLACGPFPDVSQRTLRTDAEGYCIVGGLESPRSCGLCLWATLLVGQNLSTHQGPAHLPLQSCHFYTGFLLVLVNVCSATAIYCLSPKSTLL